MLYFLKIIYVLFLILFSNNSFAYDYYKSCSSYGNSKCYDDIVYSCNQKYASNVLNAQTQYNRMGCIADSMTTILPGWENRLLNHLNLIILIQIFIGFP